MKISLQWLRDYLPGPLAAQEAGEALTAGGLPVESIEPHEDDMVIDVEVTSNRGDCLSHIGIARELAALLGRPLVDVQPEAAESATPVGTAASVRIDALDLCPHYTVRIIRGVKIGPSPPWLTRRLEAVGLRPINNIVDVTNYVMFEMGQPLHAFDYNKLEGRSIIVRTAQLGEKMVSIDGRERQLQPAMLVIADQQRPVALAGVMGGVETEVTDSTVNILLESARFDPLNVRRTARALAMQSDSSYRFERGIDPTLPERASLRAAQLILQTAGGELLGGVVTAGATGHEPKTLTLRLKRLAGLLGIEVKPERVADALARLQLRPVLHDGVVEVVVPSWRLDLNIEVDLIEEVARIIGYDEVPVRDEISIRVSPPEPEAKTIDLIRSTLVAGGYFEAVTFSFVSDALMRDFMPPEAASLLRTDPSVRKTDAHLRPSILPGLLEAVRRNETAGTAGAKLFEIGSTFWSSSAGAVEERRRVGLVGSGSLREVRGVLEQVLSRLDAHRAVRVAPDERTGYAQGACGRIEWGGEPIGHVGHIDRAIADRLDLREVPVVAELELPPLLAGMQHVPQLRPLPRFPAIRRDLSLVVAEQVRYEQFESVIRQQRPELLDDLEYVTTYRGKPLEKGQKSVTVTLIFRSPAGTLTAEQVEPQVQRIIDAARQQLGGALRT